MGRKVLVIGGGPAGMMAAGKAAESGADVTLLEKNERLGKKLAITGKGRGNLTNTRDIHDFMQQIPGNSSFLYGAFNQFSNEMTIRFFEDLGVATKEERGGRIFPQSNRAIDVVKAFEKYLSTYHVNIKYGAKVKRILLDNNIAIGVETEEGQTYLADRVIVATGGISYPSTGSTGEGYQWARDVGHQVSDLYPSLIPIEIKEDWVKALQGLTLKNVNLSLYVEDILVDEAFGEMIFTHFGISGPVVLTLSRQAVLAFAAGKRNIRFELNLKPALSLQQLDNRLQRDFVKFQRKQLKNACDELLPKTLIPVFIHLTGIPETKPVHQITREERQRIIHLLTKMTMTLKKPRTIQEAIITMGGINVKEINPKTMESKKIHGLFWAGEIIDVDAYTGGYNLQIAFSTGFTAGMWAAN